MPLPTGSVLIYSTNYLNETVPSRQGIVGRIITTQHHRAMCQRKGHTPEDYRQAAEEGGSIRAVARILDVSRTTAREQCARHDIELESIDGVPEGRQQ